jgi:L-threonylcarbamoyladenylate synthase
VNLLNDLSFAAHCLKKGELVVIPTETVYGLASNALNANAVSKIFQIKKRPTFNPLIIHTDSFEKLSEWVLEIPESAKKLASAFWPGPMSLLLKKKDVIPDLVTAGSPYVVVRIPNHPITQSLLSKLSFPIAAPSANLYQQISPTKIEHIHPEISEKVCSVLDGGSCEVGVESTIIGFEDNQPYILREGGITKEQIEAATQMSVLDKTTKVKTPGSDLVHYSTHKKLIVTNNASEFFKNNDFEGRCTLILWSEQLINDKNQIDGEIFYWSKEKKLNEAAINLYSLLHQADKNNSRFIVAEWVPNQGLGVAINDRLKRAAHEVI